MMEGVMITTVMVEIISCQTFQAQTLFLLLRATVVRTFPTITAPHLTLLVYSTTYLILTHKSREKER